MIKRFEVSEETTLQEVFEYIKVKYNEIPDLEDRENFLKAIVREVDYENKQNLDSTSSKEEDTTEDIT